MLIVTQKQEGERVFSMKKYIYLFVGFMLITFVVMMFTKSREKHTSPSRPEISELTAPRIFPDFNTPVSFFYNGPPVNLPPSLPVYTISFLSIQKESIQSIAEKLGFTTPLSQPVSWVYDWIQKKKHFSYNDQNKTISYGIEFTSPLTLPLDHILQPDDVIEILSASGFFSDYLEVKKLSSTNVTDNHHGLENPIPISIFDYNAYIKNTQFPVYFSIFQPVGDIKTLSDGRVISFSFRLLPQIQVESINKIMDIPQLIDELNQQKGFLVSVNAEKTAYANVVSPTFFRVNINSISLAYMVLSEENKIIPIFDISGSGLGAEKIQNVRYIIKAGS
jgi:hypothetical protein